MNKLYSFCVILSIILSPLYSLSEENPLLKETPTKYKSRITVTGSAAITVVNNSTSNYGPTAMEIVTKEGGKINRVIKGKDGLLSDTQANESDEMLSKVSTIDLPSEFVIDKAYPNPFNPTVNIRYGLPEDAAVKIIIHDIQGRLINKLSLNKQSAGWHEYHWNGRDLNGQSIGTGVYLFTIQAGNLLKNQKITFLK